ncbi:MAG TPA: STAS domain-containing protein [Solirubrobacteraceae bacterium]|nr:STAS domain-containing protein [Solirubrobacteraceae bacterium]
MLRCCGDEDRSTQSLRRGPLSRALRGEDHLTVDLSELVFADTSLMLDLVMLARRLGKRERIMRMRGAQPQIQRLIELLGVHRLPGIAVDGLDPGSAMSVGRWRMPARMRLGGPRRRDRRP